MDHFSKRCVICKANAAIGNKPSKNLGRVLLHLDVVKITVRYCTETAWIRISEIDF
jgi:hypothetical protein